jgi:sulfur-carrier protein adenylyltransferase/sulfurtransferase
MNLIYERYIRHIVLKNFGLKSQDLLFKSRVLCVGSGGLGSSVLNYLISSGIGFLGLVDYDFVDKSNFNRQIIYNECDIYKNKVFLSFNYLKNLNKNVFIKPYNLKINSKDFVDLISEYDVLVDCTDGLNSKFLLNEIAMLTDISLIHASVFGFEGFISVFNRNRGCLNCIYNNFDKSNYVGHGIIGSVAGIIGAMQALETIKYLINKNNMEKFNIILMNFYENSFDKIFLNKNLYCKICSK